ncbi:MAG: hypothetical protein V3V45_08905, partial [Candidatus Brocadiales bacterium]
PYRGSSLREVCELEGYLKEEDLAEDYRLGPSLDMPQLSMSALSGLQRTFPLYVKFPRSEWPLIRVCEDQGPEADKVYEGLSQIYTNRYL